MTSNTHPAVRTRRLLVSGGSSLSPNAVRLWEALGKELVKEKNLTIVTGGLKALAKTPETSAADWALARGAVSTLEKNGEDVAKHIETVLPGKKNSKLLRFEEGRVIKLWKKSSQARRFSMLASSDIVVSIEGNVGTKSVLELALALEKPFLSVPFGEPNTTSAKRWKDYRSDILKWFDISEETAKRWEFIKLDDQSDKEISALAYELKSHLLKGFTRKCFFVMPFKSSFDRVYEEALEPVMTSLHIKGVRMDKLVLFGNAVQNLRSALRSCDVVIADITGTNANVMYEIGFAHAEEKPVILLNHREHHIPFDIGTEHVIEYGENMDELREALIKILDETLR